MSETLYSITGLVMYKNTETNEEQVSLVENKSFRNIMSKLYNYVVENQEDDWDTIYEWIEDEHDTSYEFNLATELDHDKPAENMIEFIVLRAHNAMGI